MKNFSVKTADFDSLSISGEAPIVQSDLGTAPNQIPLNKDLGSLAYMNAPQIEDINVDTLELREIAAELSETAVDVFVYDTRKDSDGGAWRHRTQHTSWYNETLNTATRGSRREFPAVAVIVSQNSTLTIYDGDDPDLPMWMKWTSDNGARMIRNSTSPKIAAKNGIIALSDTGTYGGVIAIYFITDTSRSYRALESNNKSEGYWLSDIAGRNDYSTNNYSNSTGGNILPAIVSESINDIAMTVLPNAPIDSATGLPIPTIAVATDAGVSVIKDDGSVVDITAGADTFTQVSFTKDNDIVTSDQNITWAIGGIPSRDTTYSSWNRFQSYGIDYTGIHADFNFLGTHGTYLTSVSQKNIGADLGLTLIEEDVQNKDLSSICYVSSTYNTGWMHGDIKLATLSDTKIEKVGVDETNKLIDEEFNTDANEAGFTAAYPGWGTWLGTCSVVNNKLRVIDDDGNGAAATTNFATVIGERYIVSFDYELGTADKLAFWIDGNESTGDADIHNSGDITSGSTRSVEFTATSTTTYLLFLAYGTNQYGEFGNISVRQTGELITNGTFDNGTEGWLSYNGGIIDIDSNRLSVEGSAYQEINVENGKTYLISCKVELGSTIGSRVGIEYVLGNRDGVETPSNEGGEFIVPFTSSITGTVYVRAFTQSNGTAYFDNISVRLAEDDRSVNNNGLQIFGEIDKTPVAPGADLVAYSGFSANNYLMQPYNSDLDFGTGDFSIMGWFKNANNLSTLLSRMLPQVAGTIGTDRGFSVAFTTSNKLRFSIYTRGFNSTQGRTVLDSDDNKTEINTWTHFVVTREGGKIKFYFNGKKQASETANSDDISDNTMSIPLSVGCFNETSAYGFTGSVALIRISATVPTADQIAKIYRDEKPLFTDGAQATLYGTSDAVTALAYDDSDDLLHVGTASGRSSFNGLKRVENTDVAVTTAISATEGLVIEQ